MTGAREAPGEVIPLRELASVFLRLSLLGFGGPNAHLALMLEEVVERRRWLSREHFLELVAITNLLPGPNSSGVAIHIGHVKRGVPGALVTGGVFLLPAFLMVTGLAALYFGPLGDLPLLDPVFTLVKPVVLALILRAAWKLGRTAVTDGVTLVLALVGAGVGAAAGGWAVPAMLLGGAVTWGMGPRSKLGKGSARRPSIFALGGLGATPLPIGGVVAFLVTGSPVAVFLHFLAIGSVLFGGGYTLVALLQPTAVEGFGWLDSAAFLDGVAITQAVPGPISTLAAFVGYAAAGAPGAIAGTAGVYLPAFVAVLVAAPLLERVRRDAAVKAALRGIGAVVAGTILGVAFVLVPEAIGWSGDAQGVALRCGVSLVSVVALIRGITGPGALIGAALAMGVGWSLIGAG